MSVILIVGGAAVVAQRHSVVNDCKGGGALCAGNAVALLVFGPVMP